MIKLFRVRLDFFDYPNELTGQKAFLNERKVFFSFGANRGFPFIKGRLFAFDAKGAD